MHSLCRSARCLVDSVFGLSNVPSALKVRYQQNRIRTLLLTFTQKASNYDVDFYCYYYYYYYSYYCY